MIFSQIAPEYKGLIMTWYLFITLTFGYVYFCAVRHRRKFYVSCVSGAMFWIAYISLQSMNPADDIIKNFPYIINYSSISWLFSVITGVIYSILAVLCLLEDSYWTRNNITPMSVKESADIIPTGLCFYKENNATVLVNQTMEKLSQKMFGRSLFSGTLFWDDMMSGKVLPDVMRLEYSGSPIIRTADGAVWMFDRKEISISGGEAYQITAVDVTDLYGYIRRVREDTFRLRKLNHRLRKYGSRVDDVVRTEENLSARVRIHNDMGKVLLAVKAYIQNTPGITGEELLNMWKMNLELMHGNAMFTDEKLDPMDSLKNAAAFLGINLSVYGERPEDDFGSRLYFAAAREALTNSVRHGKATELNISSEKTDNGYTVTYINNGNTPEEDIKEGSGLGNLRKMLENAGCTMKIEVTPEFRLMVYIKYDREQNDEV